MGELHSNRSQRSKLISDGAVLKTDLGMLCISQLRLAAIDTGIVIIKLVVQFRRRQNY